MAIFIITVYIILGSLLAAKNLDSISKRIIMPYLGIWLIALLISISSIYGMYKPQDSTIYIILAHIVMFTLGFIMATRTSYNVDNLNFNNHFQHTIDNLTRNKVFLASFALSLLYVLYLFSKFALAIMFSNKVGAVRDDFFSGELLGTGFIMINSLFLVPWNMLMLALFCYMLIYKRNVLCWFIGLEYILYSSLSGSRGGLLDIIIGVFFVVFCLGNVINKNSRKIIVQTLLLFVTITILVSWLTSIRSNNLEFNSKNIQTGIEDLITHTTAYLGGPTVAFDYALNRNYIDEVGGYQYGQMTFASIEEFFFYLRSALNKVINIGLYERPINKIGSMMQERIDLGGLFYWNALYTSCMYYYLDFGVVGVIVLPFIFGFIIRRLILMFYTHNSFYIYLICSFLFIIMIDSVTRLYFFRFSQLAFIIIAYILSKSKSNISTNKTE